VLGLLTAAPQLPSGNGHAPGLTAEGLREKEHAAAERGRVAGLPIRASTLNRQGLPAGTKAPGFRLRDLEGRQRSLAEFGGKQVLLVFSDPDCGPCQALAPDLVRLAEQHRADHLQVLMVSRGELAANLAKAKEHGFPFPVLLQKGWQVSKEYAMFATPHRGLTGAGGRRTGAVRTGTHRPRRSLSMSGDGCRASRVAGGR